MSESIATVIELPEGDSFAPNTLAELLFGKDGAYEGGKRVRGYLRANFTRPVENKGKTWTLDRTVAQQTLDHFIALRTTERTTADDANEGGDAD